MRVCQPAPLARQRAITSGGNRRLMETFGLSSGGRPTGLPPRLRTERESISSVSSGTSLSGLVEVRRVPADFARIALPHGDNVTSGSSYCICNHHHPTVEIPDAKNSTFTVIPAGIFNFQRQTGENITRPFEIESALNQRSFALGIVVGDSHVIYCRYVKSVCQAKNAGSGWHRRRLAVGVAQRREGAPSAFMGQYIVRRASMLPSLGYANGEASCC